MRIIYIIALTILIAISLTSASFAQFSTSRLTIIVSQDESVTVTHKLNVDETAASIDVKALSSEINDLLAVDENNIALATTIQGDIIKIDSLGASSVTLSYRANILEKSGDVLTLAFTADTSTLVKLPKSAEIIYLNDLPLEMSGENLLMPAGDTEISYVLRETTVKPFDANWEDKNYPVEISTSASIENFQFVQQNKLISFSIGDASITTVKIPQVLLGGPFIVLLNGKSTSFSEYYSDASHSWLRIEPASKGKVEIKGTTVIPEFPFYALSLVFVMLLAVPLLMKIKNKNGRLR